MFTGNLRFFMHLQKKTKENIQYPYVSESSIEDAEKKSVEKWIATFPEVQQKKIRSKLIAGIRFVPVEWKAYNKPDTSSLAVYYDSTIASLKSTQDEWIKALAVIALYMKTPTRVILKFSTRKRTKCL